MSKKELQRKTLLDCYRCGKLTLCEVADRADISYRQAKRLWRRYQESQDKGLIHRNRGKKPLNAYAEDFKQGILSVYQTKYFEFGPTYAAEKLLEDDHIAIHPETLRLWLKKAGLWDRKRKRIVYRERRERRACFGELLQIDGSIHQWFSGINEHYCLLNMVDDATGICHAALAKGETTHVLLTTFMQWIKTYGIPKAVYVDLKSVYVSPKMLKEKYDDDLLIKEGFSIFEQVCKKLNIQIIRAYSPQAKGRVERKHGVFQDRLVKDLKLYKIQTLEEANAYLEKFLVKINNKFAKPKGSVPDAHRDPSPYGDLDQILCWHYRRQLRHDWCIQFEREYYQIKKGYEDILKPEDFIVIKRHLDGQMCFWHGDTQLQFEKLQRKPLLYSDSKDYRTRKGPEDRLKRQKRLKKASLKSPWRLNPNWLKSA
jgi:hypothetical protein